MCFAVQALFESLAVDRESTCEKAKMSLGLVFDTAVYCGNTRNPLF